MNKLVNRTTIRSTTNKLLTITHTIPSSQRLLTYNTKYHTNNVLNKTQYQSILQSLHAQSDVVNKRINVRNNVDTARTLARQFASRPNVYDTTYTESNPQQSYNSVSGSMNKPETAGQALQRDVGMARHMSKTFQTTFYGLLGWSASILLMNTVFPGFMAMHPIMTALGGFVLSIGGIFGMSSIQPIFRTLPDGSAISINPQNRILCASAAFIGLGITTSPLVMLLSHYNPAAIPISIVSALGVMGGSYLYARTRPDGSLTTMGPVLTGTLIAMIGVGLVNMFLHSPMVSNVMSLAAIPLFAAFTAYDTHTAMDDYRNGRPDHLLHSVNFFLNFANLFQSIAHLAGFGNMAPSVGSQGAGAASGMGADGLGTAAGAGLAGSDTGFDNIGELGDNVDFGSGLADSANNVDAPGLFDGIGNALSAIWDFISGFFGDR